MLLSKLTKAKFLRTINIEIMVIIGTITTITPITKIRIRIKSMLQRALLLKKLSPKLKLKSSPQLSQFQSRWRLLKRKNQSHLNLKRRKCQFNKLSNWLLVSMIRKRWRNPWTPLLLNRFKKSAVGKKLLRKLILCSLHKMIKEVSHTKRSIKREENKKEAKNNNSLKGLSTRKTPLNQTAQLFFKLSWERTKTSTQLFLRKN